LHRHQRKPVFIYSVLRNSWTLAKILWLILLARFGLMHKVASDCAMNHHSLKKPSRHFALVQRPSKHMAESVLSVRAQSIFIS
jgi:hypothetical protein